MEEKKEEKKIDKENPKTKENKKSFPVVVVAVALALILGVVALRVFSSKMKTRVAENLVSKIISGGVEGDVKVEDEGEKVTYKGEDFEFSFGSGEELPENFPKDFPVYPQSKLVSNWSSEDGEGTGMSLTWEAEGKVADVIKYYKESLEKSDWEIVSTFEDGSSAAFTLKGKDYDVMLGIAESEGKVDISAAFGEN